ncbi:MULTISPECIES: gamma-glutamylcyclotransferase [unclassified Coleofasciculus]|uniref:gamma-glutamylcyclotransferase n=1 Tax=unclassified Coleofasciculus TaxID=2692782 RepID=UPI001881376F|nr:MULTISPECIES: gamma-glutamylcyclotransferase [unclassified Coleofasciculus]MBE9128096.1 gamma-glutamylcyclotransferase [Coleofasciculus sp. LEGE 07081]MBE9146969.1 gamma-glutamylcyclotransferase [Coleofasciculus sp. LEGE 07092]
MSVQSSDRQGSPSPFPKDSQLGANVLQLPLKEPTFYYFAYGSCMCPVDLKRSLGESTHDFVMGSGLLHGYRLAFNRKSLRRNCGVLDIVPDPTAIVEGVLYCLPWRCSDTLDEREEVPRGGYRRETIEVHCRGHLYKDVRTYVVVDKLAEELAPDDWYFNVVLRGAVTCGLTEPYCWKLFDHMHQLQQRQWQTQPLRSA